MKFNCFRFDPHRNAIWDGKLGIWAFTDEYTAQRNSKWHSNGEVYLRNIEVIDRGVYKDYLLRLLFPAIKEKWPRKDRHRPIMVQQDNARPHVSPFDPDILAAGLDGGWNIRLKFQPPNSPEMNVLDLGLFASLQSLQYRQKMKGIEDIVRAVCIAYSEMTSETQDNIFLSLQNCMRSILKAEGGNGYALPHLGKAKLRKGGMLPTSLPCDRDVYNHALDVLREANRGSACFF